MEPWTFFFKHISQLTLMYSDFLEPQVNQSNYMAGISIYIYQVLSILPQLETALTIPYSGWDSLADDKECLAVNLHGFLGCSRPDRGGCLQRREGRAGHELSLGFWRKSSSFFPFLPAEWSEHLLAKSHPHMLLLSIRIATCPFSGLKKVFSSTVKYKS